MRLLNVAVLSDRSAKSRSRSSSLIKEPIKPSPPVKSYRRPSLSDSESSEFEEGSPEAFDKKSVTDKSDTSNKK